VLGLDAGRQIDARRASEGTIGHRDTVESWFFSASTLPANYQGLAF
jgi:hypothetical protein